MKEFPLNIPLNKGLRPDFRSPRNSGFLVECMNAKVKEFGLVPYEPPEIPFSQSTLNAVGIDGLGWPFPQLFKGKKRTILAAGTRLFYVNEEDWSLWELEDFYKVEDPNNTGSIVQGNQWQFVDFWDTWMLHNGISTVFHSNRHLYTNEYGVTDKVYINEGKVIKMPRVQAGTAFRGRAWFGGFDEEFFWSSGWTGLYDDWATRKTTDIIKTLENLGENVVFWTSIGGGDMLNIFHAASNAISGNITSNYGSEDPLVFDYLKRNEQGSMPMPWQGKIRQIKPLGSVVMIYGDGGISALRPTGNMVGLIEFDQLKHGISNTGAIGGNWNEHVFLDNSGRLWHIDKSLALSELGYREYFDPLLGTDVVVSYDSAQGGEFHICNGYKSFILTKQGLTEHSQQITSIINTQGKTYCMGVDPEAIDKTFKLETDTFDIRENNFKTLTWVQASHELPSLPSPSQLFCSARFRYKTSEAWRETNEVQLNDEGVARLVATAKDFRIKLRSDDYRDVNLDNVMIKYQLSDRRYTRGPSAAEVVS